MGWEPRIGWLPFSGRRANWPLYRRLYLRAQIRTILAGKGPQSRAWERLLEDIDESRDRAYLLRLKAAATQAEEADGPWQPQEKGFEPWLDDLVRRIDSRLGLLAMKGKGH